MTVIRTWDSVPTTKRPRSSFRARLTAKACNVRLLGRREGVFKNQVFEVRHYDEWDPPIPVCDPYGPAGSSNDFDVITDA